MPKLYSSDYIVKVLIAHGFYKVSQKGSHAKFRTYTNPVKTAIVPMDRKQIPIGTFHSIVRQSGLSSQDFE
jgi:predicted RNA binding protein YcfA (HicA-like mRNA interferase family)